MKSFIRLLAVAALLAAAVRPLASQQPRPAVEPSLISFSAGALIVQKPAEYDKQWSAFWLLDERPDSGWASPDGEVANHVLVIELAEKTLLKRLEFDTGSVDG
jgi:hypothetical protein